MLSSNEIKIKAQKVHQNLNLTYGEQIWQKPTGRKSSTQSTNESDPAPLIHNLTALDELIATILSANTNDVNSGRAFRQLKERFDDDWETIRTAPLDEIKEAIRPAGMYNQKAPSIVKTLTMLKEGRGIYDLEHLNDMDINEAMAYLCHFPGVGHKTASIVMLFCFNAATFPVDTHVQRISQRLGISPRKATPIKVKAIWETLLPPETFYSLHLNLIQHGRQRCDARKPDCGNCPLANICDYACKTGEWAIVE